MATATSVLVVILIFYSFYFLVKASFTDPGILPRREIILATPGLREKLKERFGYDMLNIDNPQGPEDVDSGLGAFGRGSSRGSSIVNVSSLTYFVDFWLIFGVF